MENILEEFEFFCGFKFKGWRKLVQKLKKI